MQEDVRPPSRPFAPSVEGGVPSAESPTTYSARESTGTAAARRESRLSSQQHLLQQMESRTSVVASMRRSSPSQGATSSVNYQNATGTGAYGTSNTRSEELLNGASGTLSYDGTRTSTPRLDGDTMGGAAGLALSPELEDFVHEILAMNTLGMERCYNKTEDKTEEEPMSILSEAYLRLNDMPESLPGTLGLQLKATTLNNMGVVECHRGQPRQALSHFEAARQLEEGCNVASPSVALNTCAAYNALHMYDKATAAALECIDMLRVLEVQRQRLKKLQQCATALSTLDVETAGLNTQTLKRQHQLQEEEEALLLAAAAEPQIADSENAALWGAAWNNLAVAQINIAKGSRDLSEYTNTLTLFQNAMQATQDLIGMDHPMTKSVVMTFRSVRRALRNHGAFKQHRTQLRAPLPPVDPREQELEELQLEPDQGRTKHATLLQHQQKLTITFRGEVTGGQKLIERVDATPYPGAASEAYQAHSSPQKSGRCREGGSSRRKGRRSLSNSRTPALLRGMRLSGTLLKASELYGNPHPLLYSPSPGMEATALSTMDAAPYSSDGGMWWPQDSAAALEGSNRDRHPRKKAPKSNARMMQTAPLPDRRHPRPPSSGNSARYKTQPTVRPPSDKRRLQQTNFSNAQVARLGDQRPGGNGLPPIASTAAGSRGSFNGTTDTNASTVYMHYPPPPASLGRQNTAQPRQEILQHQAKLLLLASPSDEAAGGGGVGRGRMSPRPAGESSSGRFGPNHSNSSSPPPAAEGPSRELFRGMWVSGSDAPSIQQGNRLFGRPAYYTVSSVLNVTADGKPEGAGDDTVAPGCKAPGNVMPSLMYMNTSSSSSSDDGNNATKEAEPLDHSVSSKNFLAETARA